MRDPHLCVPTHGADHADTAHASRTLTSRRPVRGPTRLARPCKNPAAGPRFPAGHGTAEPRRMRREHSHLSDDRARATPCPHGRPDAAPRAGLDVDDATLAASELVTNAYRHANTAGPELRVRLADLTDGALLLEVSDPLPGFMPRIPNPERGRVLPLLDQLAKHLDCYEFGPQCGHDRGSGVRGHE
ncbi:ATP-binding protein [Streptomyces sp. NPDC056728]